MSELLSKRPRLEPTGSGRSVVACFCGDCSRLLYVVEAEVLFCPVCSSAVSRVHTDTEEDLAIEQRATDR